MDKQLREGHGSESYIYTIELNTVINLIKVINFSKLKTIWLLFGNVAIPVLNSTVSMNVFHAY